MPCDFFGFEERTGDFHAGDIITAQDPDGIICGRYTVETAGRYGFLTCMGDDPNTTEVDEGAIDEDPITFYVNGVKQQRQAIWKSGEAIQLDLGIPATTDLGITSISFSNSTPRRLDTIEMFADVTNSGGGFVDTFTVNWRVDEVDIGSTQVSELGPGETATTEPVSWEITGEIGCRQVEARIGEDNTRSKNILVDLNGTGRIDIVDIMLVVVKWNTHEGDGKYVPLYDMDNDGDIDIVDIMKVARLWHVECSD
ncbi:MAG: hypothetical protein KKG21_06575 [Candidatus Omnitrophica bacterium]|nr:hypothetical protein [Candidatus Omnitrophota bacterium]